MLFVFRKALPLPFALLPILGLFLLGPWSCASANAPAADGAGRLAIYYWANTIYPDRWATLLELTPDDVFIKAGTVERTSSGLRFVPPTLRGILPLPRGLRVHAVIHHRVKDAAEAAQLAELIPGWITAGQWALSRGGITLSGIQLDLEGAWEVQAYPALLERLPLPDTWTRSVFVGAGQVSNVACVAALSAFDRVCVGTYDYSWNLDGFRPVDVPWTVEFIRRMFLGSGEKPGRSARGRKDPRADRIWLVAPCYGAVSVLDEGGQARIPFLDLASRNVFRPHVSPERTEGTRELFRVEKPFSIKDVRLTPGERLSVWKPDTRRLADELRAARGRLPGLHGVALFSWPVKTNFNPSDAELQRLSRAVR